MEFTYRFEAAHRFLQSESVPCMTPHGHTWYATLGLRFTQPTLNAAQMSVEFSEAKKHWKNLIENTFDHSYMHNINDPIVEVLTSEAQTSRLVPFPGDPTTELISLFMFNKVEQLLKTSSFHDLVDVEFIKLQETPTNTIICDRNFFNYNMESFKAFDGWWTSVDTHDRAFRAL